jgi:hypothetical protein
MPTFPFREDPTDRRRGRAIAFSILYLFVLFTALLVDAASKANWPT